MAEYLHPDTEYVINAKKTCSNKLNSMFYGIEEVPVKHGGLAKVFPLPHMSDSCLSQPTEWELENSLPT